MFGYVSIGQLSADIRVRLHLLPRDIDLVVGIPRSGMIPAYMIGLFTNRLVVDLESFIANQLPGHGSTRTVATKLAEPFAAQHVLLVDDSLRTGDSMRRCVQRIREAGYQGRISTCAIIVVPEKGAEVDFFFREMSHPRLFEWNAFHHPQISNSCFDLDGILCVDPTDHENDDGPRYLEFVGSAKPLIVPTQKIGHIVSARLEKYREPTERWLAEHGITYDKLHLIDLPSAAERQRLGSHASHKARVYTETNSILFYESDVRQARDIAQLSGRPVLCIADMSLYLPDGTNLGASVRHLGWQMKHPVGRLKRWVKRRLGVARAVRSSR
jgi:uncharacterized HAD superfamily protein/orotate phosphoribosyltransferase